MYPITPQHMSLHPPPHSTVRYVNSPIKAILISNVNAYFLPMK